MTASRLDSPENRALWAHAETIARDLLDDHECAIVLAVEDALDHWNAIKTGKPADSEYSERMFKEAGEDPEAAQVLAERVHQVLHAWLWQR